MIYINPQIFASEGKKDKACLKGIFAFLHAFPSICATRLILTGFPLSVTKILSFVYRDIFLVIHHSFRKSNHSLRIYLRR